MAARSDADARDKDGLTPADTAEYDAARAPQRSLDFLAARAALLCYDGRRSDFTDAADPAALVDVHRRLADEARRSSRSVPWADEPRASLGAPRAQGTPPHANRPRPLADRAPAPHLAPTRPTALAVTPSTTAQAPLVVAACTVDTLPPSTANDALDAPFLV